MTKKIEHLLAAREKSIGTETVLQPLPHRDFRFASPFIVLHHLPPQTYPPGSPPERIPPHPHRGFAPVTFLFQGEGFHRDSEGNQGVLGEGGVQWMFAGRGLLHSEGPTEDFLRRGGTYEFIQLWVNVPAAHKMDEPYYLQKRGADLPLLPGQPGVRLRLASGQQGGQQGPFPTHTPIITVFGSMDGGSQTSLEAPAGFWTLLYVLQGSLTVDGQEVPARHLAVFDREGGSLKLEAHTETQLIYLCAQPIDEPVAAKRNIVMNTAEEVAQAERDAAAGLFGSLEA